MSPTETTTSIFTRKYFNVLVTGHRENRLPTDRVEREKIRNELNRVLDDIRRDVQAKERTLRLFTGWSDGADSMARNWFDACHAQNNSLQFYAVSPESPPSDESRQQVTGMIGVSSERPDPIPESWHSVTDDYKLLMADVVVCIWDGKGAAGCEGGTVRVVAEAMRRRLPVIWIHADVAQAGKLQMVGSLLLSSTLIQTLDAKDPNSMTSHFSPSSEHPGLLASILADSLNPSLLEEGTRIPQKADPQQRPTFAGFWHSLFFKLLSPWKIEDPREPVGAWRGGSGTFVNTSALQDGFWNEFDRMDRTATHAANQYRDGVLLTHLLSSLAVFGAVAGAVHLLLFPDVVWVLFELAALAIIGWLVWRGRGRNTMLSARDTWLLTRQSAETMRMSALLYPQLASLPSLYQLTRTQVTTDTAKGSEKNATVELDLKSAARMRVIQILSDAEPPKANAGDGVYYLAGQSELKDGFLDLIKDQISYHKKNVEKNEKSHHRLHVITQSVFFFVLAVVFIHLAEMGWVTLMPHDHSIITVIAHWIAGQKWLLIITAFFPALAAALHGILTTFELERLAKSSELMVKRLEDFKDIVIDENDPIRLRRLAIMTAEMMFAEHDAWGELMSAHHVEIPA